MAERGTLKLGEPHPGAALALQWLRSLTPVKLAVWQEAFSSSAIEGNRTAEICSETLRRLMTNQPVSDRYLMGLAWVILSDEKPGFLEQLNGGIEALMDFNLKEDMGATDTPEARLLLNVATAVDAYEKVKFPFREPSAEELEKFRKEEAGG